MKVLFQTRFAFQGALPWDSVRAKSPKMVFDPEYLETRLDLMDQFMLPSIADQTDDDFHLYCLTSTDLPQMYDDRLVAQLEAHLGNDRFTRVKENPVRSWTRSIVWTRARYGKEPELTQICLDDDDALSVDFVELCRLQSKILNASDYFDSAFRYLSFANGFAAQVDDGRITELAHRHMPFSAPGLAIVGKGHCARSAIYPVDPLNVVPESNVITASRPFFLKLNHDANDKTTAPVDGDLTKAQIGMVETFFPFLIGSF